VTPSSEWSLAERAFAAEEARVGASPEPVPVAERVLRRLRDQLVLWFALDGYQALLARAVHRTQASYPVVAGVRAQPQDGRHLDDIRDRAQEHDPAALREALLALLAALFAILTRLVGEDLVTRLIHQIWPDGGLVDPAATAKRTPIRE
jgi:hypothetical protein